MGAASVSAPTALRDYSACSACGLCRLVCPMWRASRDPRHSPEGLAKALQSGAVVADLAGALEACSLCGACDPVCPERIDIVGSIMDMRRKLVQTPPSRMPRPALFDDLELRLRQDIGAAGAEQGAARAAVLLLPGAALRADAGLLAKVQTHLGLALAVNDGDDIVLALEAGVPIPPARLESFVVALRGHAVVATDGLLLRQLRRWLPGSQRMGLGAALSSRAALRSRLQASDFYVIEARAYHADYERMVTYYDRLQRETGCSLNLDLQRMAIPAVSEAEVRWMLQGRLPARIVVENPPDQALFRRVTGLPVLHLAELAED